MRARRGGAARGRRKPTARTPRLRRGKARRRRGVYVGGRRSRGSPNARPLPRLTSRVPADRVRKPAGKCLFERGSRRAGWSGEEAVLGCFDPRSCPAGGPGRCRSCRTPAPWAASADACGKTAEPMNEQASTEENPTPSPGADEQLADERALLRRYAKDPTPAVREELVERFVPLARRLASRYSGGVEPFDDLVQVASVGLGQGDRPLRARPRHRLLDLRRPHHPRGAEAPLPRPRLVDPRAARGSGADPEGGEGPGRAALATGPRSHRR